MLSAGNCNHRVSFQSLKTIVIQRRAYVSIKKEFMTLNLCFVASLVPLTPLFKPAFGWFPSKEDNKMNESSISIFFYGLFSEFLFLDDYSLGMPYSADHLSVYFNLCYSKTSPINACEHRVGRVLSVSPVVGIGTPNSQFQRGDIHCGALYM